MVGYSCTAEREGRGGYAVAVRAGETRRARGRKGEARAGKASVR